MIEASDLAGLVGVAMSSYCYVRIQWQRDYAKRLDYSVLNLFAAILLLVSLAYRWNLAAFVSNSIWCLMSLYGIHRCLKYRRMGETLP
jgi:hypothetical protein